MAFWRRRNSDFRPFDRRDLAPSARPTVAGAVEEGRLLAQYAARLHLKNRIEVATIGEDKAFDPEDFVPDAIEEIERLAEEQDEVANRLETQAAAVQVRERPRHVHDYHADDRRNLRHRARVARLLAADLRMRAADPGEVAEIIERARQDAWRDVSSLIEAVIDVGARPPRRPSSARKRRIADLAGELDDLLASGNPADLS